MKEKKPKRGFLEGYQTYDPKTEGFGNPDQWRSAFRERMGYAEARTYLKGKNEDGIPFAKEMRAAKTSAELKKIYHQAMKQYHPDKFGASVTDEIKARAQAIIALYTILEKDLE